jgi:thiol-disulfide isomerase/thioredoxin
MITRNLVFGIFVLAGSTMVGCSGSKDSGNSPNASGDDALVKRGRVLYQVSCQNCHGPEGHGDGSTAASLKPPPRDFAKHPWRTSPDKESIRKVIIEGIPGTTMPGARNMAEKDVDALVALVLTMAPKDPPPESVSSELRSTLDKAKFKLVEPLTLAPPMEYADLKGNKLNLSDSKGKWVLVHFWGVTCAPCLKEFPQLESFAQKQDAKGLVILPICVDEKDPFVVEDTVKPILKQLPVYVMTSAITKERYQVQSLPVTCLVDPQGRLVAKAEGVLNWSDPKFQELVEACQKTK